MDIIERRQLEDFVSQLFMYVPDETQAHKDYESMSDKATELGSHDIAHVLYEMGQDELRHKGYLEDMISRIKEVLATEEPGPKYPVGSRVKLYGTPGVTASQFCENGRWWYNVIWDGQEGLEQNWAWEEDLQLEY